MVATGGTVLVTLIHSIALPFSDLQKVIASVWTNQILKHASPRYAKMN